MKIISIADIHGRSNWIDIADISNLIKLDNVIPEYDKYIFLGDYVDSFDETDAVILFNLDKIIRFKQKYPEHVVLLLGNHDLQYMFSMKLHGCSGYRISMYQDLHKLFNDNKELFQPIYQINNYLFSHAGISTLWLKTIKDKTDEETPYDVVIRLWNNYEYKLFVVGWARGGSYTSGGPFWADMTETKAGVLSNYHQVVGHHPTDKSPYTHKLDEDSTITYVDNNKTGTYELIIE
jgi:predicted MPP superfamily phosphohydrolase